MAIRCGLLAEELIRSRQPVFLASCHPDAWTALQFRFEAEGIDFISFFLAPDDPAGGHVIFASAFFKARPAPEVAKAFRLRGQSAVKLDAGEASGRLLGVAIAGGADVLVSDGWRPHVLFR